MNSSPEHPIVVIRVDASLQIGTGHISRCLALAIGLRDLGCAVHFIARLHDGHMCEEIEAGGFEVCRLLPPLKGGAPSAPGRNTGRLLGVTLEQDAADTVAAVRRLARKPTWLIVDHYGIDADWEKLLRPWVEKIFIIDDLFDRYHQCDALLNQSTIDAKSRYKQLVAPDCQLLLGPRFALMKPGFKIKLETFQRRIGELKRILVFLGGVDQGNVTSKVLEAIKRARFVDVFVDVVIGMANPHRAAIAQAVRELDNATLHIQIPSLVNLIALADLAIGAGGVATWERCLMGLPSIVLGVADNQMEVGAELGAAGCHLFMGKVEDVTIESLLSALNTLSNTYLRQSFATKSAELVDGGGVGRVTAFLCSFKAVQIRPAVFADGHQVYAWRNAESTRRYSVDPTELILEEHLEWFRNSLKNSRRCLLVGEDSKGAFGILRYDFDEALSLAEVSIYLAPDKIGQGLGGPLLNAGEAWLRSHYSNLKTILATVMPQNGASRGMFARAGYEQVKIGFQKHLSPNAPPS